MTETSPKGVFDAIIEQRGGISKFDYAQIEIAKNIVRLMAELSRVKIGEMARTAATMLALMDCLPPVVATVDRPSSGRVAQRMAEMSVHELAQLYARTLANPDAPFELHPIDAERIAALDAKFDEALFGPAIDGVAEPPTPAPGVPGAGASESAEPSPYSHDMPAARAAPPPDGFSGR
jgi:hypothetical protein